MKPLFVAVVLLLSAPAGASAALDVYFQVYSYDSGMRGQILATNFESVAGPGLCNPAGGADCRTGPPTTLSLERGGQIVAASLPNPPLTYSIYFARPVITGVVPQAGDRVHVIADGVERAVIDYDGLPSVDGDCSPEGATVTGALTPGASLEAERPTAGAPDKATVSSAGGRYTATFPRALRGSAILLNSHTTALALDGSPVGVHVLRSTGVSCARGAGPLTQVKLGISRDKLRKVPVDRRSRYELTTRLRCPPELPTCRVTSGALAIKRNGDIGRSLGTMTYSVPGGTNRRMHGKLKPRALAALRRTGRRRVQFLIVIRPPAKLPEGIGATGLHGGYPGVLHAP